VPSLPALLESGGAPKLAYDSNQIELHFAALSYRSPGLLRYQYRLRPEDTWSDSKSAEPVFRFFDLRPGRYVAQVRASLDGVNWSPQPARITFEVLSPWYFRWWAITGFLLLIALALVGQADRFGSTFIAVATDMLAEPFAVDVAPAMSATGQHQMYSVFVEAQRGTITMNGAPLPGKIILRNFLDRRMSTAFLAFSETWITPPR
jgi:hypothetical protein